MLKNSFLITLLLSSVAAWPSYAAENAYVRQSERYVNCTVKSRTNPTEALQEANNWLKDSHEPAARHCAALALYNLGRFQESAETLEKLSTEIGDDQAQLRASIMTQAAYSWKMLKQYDKADADYKNAIAAASNANMDELSRSLLYERASMNHDRGKDLLAMQDLDNIINGDEKNTKALILRGQIYEAMKNPALARDDYKAALAASADDEDAKDGLKRVGGSESDLVPAPKKSKASTRKINTNAAVKVPKPTGVDSDGKARKTTKSKASKTKKKHSKKKHSQSY